MLTGLVELQYIRPSLSWQVMCLILTNFAQAVVFITPSFSVPCIGHIFQPSFGMLSLNMPHTDLAYLCVKNLGTTDFLMVELGLR